MADNAPTVATPARRGQAAPTLPFPIASRQSTRSSFSLGTVNLAAGAITPLSPVQIPAVGYLRGIMLEVSYTTTGGTAVLADGPFNLLTQLEFRTAAGNDIYVPMTGYQAYLAAKYGAQAWTGPYCDQRVGRQYFVTPTAGHFFLPIWFEVDQETGLGSIPALASNRSYQLQLALSALSTVFTGATAGTVTITGTAYYWTQPPAQTQGGIVQQDAPLGIGTVSQWQIEQISLTPGDKYVRSSNVGNTLRTLIFVHRNSSGARIDTNGVAAVNEIYLDNDPMYYFTQNEWEENMTRWYGYTVGSKDQPGALDTGVYVIPFHALAGGLAGDPNNSRAQYLPTLDASLLQLRGTSFGSAISTLEIITNSVIPTSPQALYAK